MGKIVLVLYCAAAIFFLCSLCFTVKGYRKADCEVFFKGEIAQLLGWIFWVAGMFFKVIS